MKGGCNREGRRSIIVIGRILYKEAAACGYFVRQLITYYAGHEFQFQTAAIGAAMIFSSRSKVRDPM